MRSLFAIINMFQLKKTRIKLLLITLVIFSGITALWFWPTTKEERIKSLKELLAEEQRQLKEFMAQEKGKGYKMPYADPYSPSIMKYEKAVEPIDCKTNEADWVECRFSECYITNNTLTKYRNVQCVFKDIVYVNDDYYYLGKPVKRLVGQVYVLIASDHVRVSCSANKIGSFSVFKSYWSGFLAGYRPVKVTNSTESSLLLNVLYLMFDSVSRLQFIRNLPLSYKVLTNELSAVVMDSYNIVGEGTVKAVPPMMSGLNVLELPDARKIRGNSRRFDPEPFIFTLLRSKGYRTAYYEDSPESGTFNRIHNGFENMPVDHYLRSFFTDVAQFYDSIPIKREKEGYCFGPKSQFQFLLDYTTDFFKLSGKKWCLTFNSIYSHDDNLLNLLDYDLVRFLYRFKKDGHLENTLLFVLSDHGARFSEARSTAQGRIEELNPFVSVILPEQLKKERPDALSNLLSNSRVLTTPYDLHATVLDALGLREHSEPHVVSGADYPRSLSWLQPIPATRSCAEAGILPHWCASTNWHNVSRELPIYSRVGEELANHVNHATRHVRHACAERRLHAISWVLTRNTTDSREAYYQTQIIMTPGAAMFEGYVIHKLEKDVFLVNDWDVVRVNKYGDEPKCISSEYPHLSKYCYCITNL